jgi:hypothetical protein
MLGPFCQQMSRKSRLTAKAHHFRFKISSDALRMEGAWLNFELAWKNIVLGIAAANPR